MNIKYYRILAKLKQKDLAIKLGIPDRSLIAKWETGQASPRAAMLVPLADALGCTVDDLLREEKR